MNKNNLLILAIGIYICAFFSCSSSDSEESIPEIINDEFLYNTKWERTFGGCEARPVYTGYTESELDSYLSYFKEYCPYLYYTKQHKTGISIDTLKSENLDGTSRNNCKQIIEFQNNSSVLAEQDFDSVIVAKRTYSYGIYKFREQYLLPSSSYSPFYYLRITSDAFYKMDSYYEYRFLYLNDYQYQTNPTALSITQIDEYEVLKDKREITKFYYARDSVNHTVTMTNDSLTWVGYINSNGWTMDVRQTYPTERKIGVYKLRRK